MPRRGPALVTSAALLVFAGLAGITLAQDTWRNAPAPVVLITFVKDCRRGALRAFDLYRDDAIRQRLCPDCTLREQRRAFCAYCAPNCP